jgi:hypothetical protein
MSYRVPPTSNELPGAPDLGIAAVLPSSAYFVFALCERKNEIHIAAAGKYELEVRDCNS